jgi:uncharacterized protein
MPLTDREEVMRALIAWVTEKRWDELPRLYAEDAVVTQPFGLPEPLRLEGREEVAAHFARAAGLPLDMCAENVVVSPLADPELILGEFDYVIDNRDTGATARAANIFVLRVRDGLIVESRDYSDHFRIGAALGR